MHMSIITRPKLVLLKSCSYGCEYLVLPHAPELLITEKYTVIIIKKNFVIRVCLITFKIFAFGGACRLTKVASFLLRYSYETVQHAKVTFVVGPVIYIVFNNLFPTVMI